MSCLLFRYQIREFFRFSTITWPNLGILKYICMLFYLYVCMCKTSIYLSLCWMCLLHVSVCYGLQGCLNPAGLYRSLIPSWSLNARCMAVCLEDSRVIIPHLLQNIFILNQPPVCYSKSSDIPRNPYLVESSYYAITKCVPRGCF